jgi:hypothetical protein
VRQLRIHSIELYARVFLVNFCLGLIQQDIWAGSSCDDRQEHALVLTQVHGPLFVGFTAS